MKPTWRHAGRIHRNSLADFFHGGCIKITPNVLIKETACGKPTDNPIVLPLTLGRKMTRVNSSRFGLKCCKLYFRFPCITSNKAPSTALGAAKFSTPPSTPRKATTNTSKIARSAAVPFPFLSNANPERSSPSRAAGHKSRLTRELCPPPASSARHPRALLATSNLCPPPPASSARPPKCRRLAGRTEKKAAENNRRPFPCSR